MATSPDYEGRRAAIRYLTRQAVRLSDRSEEGIKRSGLAAEVGLLSLFSGGPAALVFLIEFLRQGSMLARIQDRRESILEDMREAGVPSARIAHLREGGRE